ncbi:small subunit ribosomal protein S3 [Candidatus Caldarchaeum subterraneum]|uniref:Small ribosomal subunit protein uS3 n=1 Tax=Caldiarchaeum subterraneum TaxID=311458 RepID=E6N5E0_CALS0|nr:small subunit ribosomal protein S3 [Candidatus Caldarchaeum subterraneum]BAJ49310.1 small subunit ribosomal protein S3 [Candidatus Caldarchaeum subterraneum]BAJ50325.1 small subunit ribosomal protein S3 [Candidatus Caldarchaeum subterraneum]GBC72328.1 30S ribosomal protein S3 [archaeon HR03]
MTLVKQILETRIKKADIEEYLREKLKNAFFGGVSISFTPLGTRVTIYAMRPSRVIGPKGKVIKEITEALEKQFGVENPVVTVVEVEVPELNPYVMAERIAQDLARGLRYRRVGFWAVKRIMEAGAKGVEVHISGKLTSARSRTEKFTEGFMPKSGELAMNYVLEGKSSVLLKTGLFGVRVLIYPPDAPLPEEIKVKQIEAPRA